MKSVLAHLRRREAARPSRFLTQEVVPAEGHALRAVVLGREVITYWKRPQRENQGITTISRGAVIDGDWRPDLQQKAAAQTRKLAAAAGIDLAAVDFVLPLAHPEPSPLFLEINYYFGRRGLGGSVSFYQRLFKAIQVWLEERGLDPEAVRPL